MTERQENIKRLRDKLNAPDAEVINPFSSYKIITYLCVIILPLVPLAGYRLWCPRSDFTVKERNIWTAVMLAITVYMIKFTCFI